jgi:hypothetical protein
MKPFAGMWMVVSVRDAGPLHIGTNIEFARSEAEAARIADQKRRDWDHVRIAPPWRGGLPGQGEEQGE